MATATLRCRPSESEKEPIMAFMSAAQMLSLKLKNGDLCNITWKDQIATAVAWLTSKADLKEGVIGVSRWLQDRCGIKLENKVTVEKASVLDAMPKGATAETVIVPLGFVEGNDEMSEEEKTGWAFLARIVVIESYRFLVAGQRFFMVAGRQKREVEVLGRSRGNGKGSHSEHHDIYKIGETIRVTFQRQGEVNETKKPPVVTFDSVGGLATQKRLLKKRLRQLSNPDMTTAWSAPSQGPHGILLWGPNGTGKSLLRKAIEAEVSWNAICQWNSQSPSIKLTDRPCLIHVNLINKPTEQESSKILQLFSDHSESTLILGEIHDPNDLPTFLRTESTFVDEVEIPAPDVSERKEIFSILSQNLLDDEIVQQVAARTHGFVGRDLARLLRELSDQVVDDFESDDVVTNNPNDVKVNDADPPTYQQTSPILLSLQPASKHLTAALSRVRPSALQSIALSKPTTKWSDISGQSDFKLRLQNAVNWPLHYPSQLKSYKIPPAKGMLLYGPPGCSKTMLVRALACESDHNFLAVKGAELISMYVGESERAVREVFRKARSAAPCIIFFDEIDSIAARRSGGGGGSSSELNVLTTLLNEMDGFDTLRDVFIVAATNKPEVIDPALMRPGRFDNAVYIGPPDSETRGAILTEQLRDVHRIYEEVFEAGAMVDFVTRTDGFSGADMVAVCRVAGELAFQRGLDIGFESEDAKVGVADVKEAIVRTPRSITRDMIRDYEEWNKTRA